MVIYETYCAALLFDKFLKKKTLKHNHHELLQAVSSIPFKLQALNSLILKMVDGQTALLSGIKIHS